MSSERPVEGVRKIRVRIETLSDLVFGLALSLGSIVLVQNLPQKAVVLESDVVEFAFSFLIIVGVWLGYTRIISVLPVETTGAVLLNLALLFCVALEPFLYYVLYAAPSDFGDFSSAAYALNTGAMMGMIASMMYLLYKEDKGSALAKTYPLGLKSLKVATVTQGLSAAMFLASVSGLFWVEVPGLGHLRFLLWYAALAVFFTSRVFIRRGPTPASNPTESRSA